MPWGRLEDDLHENEKVWSFTHQEFRVWMYSISYCNARRSREPERYDVLSEEAARGLCRLAKVGPSVIRGLVEKRGWDRTDAGRYRVHDLKGYGPKLDLTAAERQARHRAKTPGNGVTHTVINEQSHAPVTRDVTHPVPEPGPVPIPGSSPPVDLAQEINTGGKTRELARNFAVVPANGKHGSPQAALKAAAKIAFGFTGQTAKEQEREATAVSQLVKAGVTPDEFGALVAEYRRRGWPNPSLTAIAGRLGQLRAPFEPGRRPEEREVARGMAGVIEAFPDLSREGA